MSTYQEHEAREQSGEALELTRVRLANARASRAEVERRARRDLARCDQLIRLLEDELVWLAEAGEL